MHKAVVFDFFDVIHADPQKAFFKRHGFTRSGGFAEASDLLDTGQIGYKEYLERFAKHSGQSYTSVRAQFLGDKLDHDVKELIKILNEMDITTALLSNTCREEISPIFNAHNLPELFEEIVISAEVGLRKPDPAIFVLMLERLSLQPHEAIFVDDNPDNVAAAESVGMSGIIFTDHGSLVRDLHAFGIRTPEPAFA
jgi:putative hydrolase of the HAD superfamily